jgi:glycosyltransferase involved in cell wall biosynthesis
MWPLRRRAPDPQTRVCVIGSGFHFMSGISTHTCMLANALAEEYQTSVVLMRRLLPRRLYPGRDRVGAPLTSMRYRDDVAVYDGVDYYWGPSFVGAVWFLLCNRPDVLVFQWWTGTVLHSFLALAAVGRLLGAKVIIEFHETLDTAESALPLADAYARVASRPLIALTSAAVVHSGADVEPVRTRFPGLRNTPVRAVPMAWLETTVDPRRGSHRPPGRSAFRLLYFGTIRPYKGLENLIRAFDALGPEQAELFRLTVVGETWQGWNLPAELIAASRYRHLISFVNTYVTDEQAAQHFREADAVVLPYLRSSGSGPLHMAMSYGLPVAVTAVGGLVEAVAAYTGARLVRPGDVDDLAEALLELRGMPGPHDDPHSWSQVTRQLGALFA